MAGPVRDKWAEWLLDRGTAGDKEGWLEFLRPVRNRVLENASLLGEETLLDVGTGDGLSAFGALDLLGERGKVVFADISQDLLDHSRALAEEMGVAESVPVREDIGDRPVRHRGCLCRRGHDTLRPDLCER